MIVSITLGRENSRECILGMGFLNDKIIIKQSRGKIIFNDFCFICVNNK